MQAIVDRIEGDMAVLEVDGTKFMDVPLAEMPEGCAEGDVYEGGPGAWVKDLSLIHISEPTRRTD